MCLHKGRSPCLPAATTGPTLEISDLTRDEILAHLDKIAPLAVVA